MINPLEIQIGNHIMHNDVFSEVVKIDKDIIGVVNESSVDVIYNTPDKFEPIEIHELFLELFGFKYNDLEYVKAIDKDTYIVIHLASKSVKIEQYDIDANMNTIYVPKADYLHQLQNYINVLSQSSNKLS